MTDDTPGGRRLLGRDERREAILQGAAAAFAQAGYAATTIVDIAKACGVTKLIVYRHFESKEALYRGVLDHVTRELRQTTAKSVASDPTGDTTRGWARALLHVARSDSDAFRLLFQHAPREEEFASYTTAVRRVVVARVESQIGELGEPPLPVWAAESVVSHVIDAVVHWLDLHPEGGADDDDRAAELVAAGVHAMVAAWRETAEGSGPAA